MAWNYERNESKGFKPIPEGKHRVRIKSAEKAQSKNSGNDMIALQLEVSGHTGLLFHYIVFMPDKPDVTNRNLTQFFDSFKDIPDGSFDLAQWVGKVGAAQVKHEEYNGDTKARIHYFIKAQDAADLPAWVEPEHKDSSSDGGSKTLEPITQEEMNNLPFF